MTEPERHGYLVELDGERYRIDQRGDICDFAPERLAHLRGLPFHEAQAIIRAMGGRITDLQGWPC